MFFCWTPGKELAPCLTPTCYMLKKWDDPSSPTCSPVHVCVFLFFHVFSVFFINTSSISRSTRLWKQVTASDRRLALYAAFAAPPAHHSEALVHQKHTWGFYLGYTGFKIAPPWTTGTCPSIPYRLANAQCPGHNSHIQLREIVVPTITNMFIRLSSVLPCQWRLWGCPLAVKYKKVHAWNESREVQRCQRAPLQPFEVSSKLVDTFWKSRLGIH